MAEARGFHREVLRSLERALRTPLAEHRDGELIRSSDFYDMLRERNVSITHTSEVLKRMEALPRPSRPFEKWLANSLERPTEASDPRQNDGPASYTTAAPSDPRPRNRQDTPGSPGPRRFNGPKHDSHLRQVTREDILAHADTLHGNQRRNVLVSLNMMISMRRTASYSATPQATSGSAQQP